MADDAIAKRNCLIAAACSQHADAHLRANEVSTFDCPAAVGRQMHLHGQSGLLHHALRELADNVELVQAFFDIAHNCE
ncbi:hypothetical protein D3C84_953370 [compost metagenome]